uniref:Uncharacterized protein n=1 Tax=Arundo donax TaxID=35708 RepID=A0A0A9CDC7_ARUDO
MPGSATVHQHQMLELRIGKDMVH